MAFWACEDLASVTIDSTYVYTNLTSYIDCGYLLDNATTVRVLSSIIEGGATNTYLNDKTKFTRSETAVDGYYVFA